MNDKHVNPMHRGLWNVRLVDRDRFHFIPVVTSFFVFCYALVLTFFSIFEHNSGMSLTNILMPIQYYHISFDIWQYIATYCKSEANVVTIAICVPSYHVLSTYCNDLVIFYFQIERSLQKRNIVTYWQLLADVISDQCPSLSLIYV